MSDSSAKKWLVGTVAVAVICVAGFFIIRSFNKSPTTPDLEVGRVVADKFLSTVRAGKAGEAWDAATAEFKSIEGRESFIQKAKATPTLTGPLQFASSQAVVIKEEPRTEYLFQSPKAKMVRVLIGNERGDWKVDRLTL